MACQGPVGAAILQLWEEGPAWGCKACVSQAEGHLSGAWPGLRGHVSVHHVLSSHNGWAQGRVSTEFGSQGGGDGSMKAGELCPSPCLGDGTQPLWAQPLPAKEGPASKRRAPSEKAPLPLLGTGGPQSTQLPGFEGKGPGPGRDPQPRAGGRSTSRGWPGAGAGAWQVCGQQRGEQARDRVP